jgi:hypothetical protein
MDRDQDRPPRFLGIGEGLRIEGLRIHRKRWVERKNTCGGGSNQKETA